MIHEELSGEVIGAAMEVLNQLKPGLDEKLYERAMIIELKHCGHVVAVQSSFPASYRGELIGNLIPDLIVDDAVIVDPKVVSCFTDTHVAQMIGYLNITRLDLALLINFKKCAIGMETSVASQGIGQAQCSRSSWLNPSVISV